MRVLALSQAVRTGFCILQDGRISKSGVEDFTPRRGKDNETLFLEFRRWLSQMIRSAEVDETHAYDLIVLSDSHPRGKASAEIQTEMTTRIKEKVAETEMEYVAVTSETWKKSLLGKPNATKVQMGAWATSKLQRKPEEGPVDDSEAEAVALAFYGYQEYNVKGEEPKE